MSDRILIISSCFQCYHLKYISNGVPYKSDYENETMCDLNNEMIYDEYDIPDHCLLKKYGDETESTG